MGGGEGNTISSSLETAMNEKEIELLTTLNQVIAEPVGLQIATSNVDKFKRKFYALRKKCKEEGIHLYNNIRCETCLEKPNQFIWLVNSKEENND